jgi:hypothetical protein
MIRFKLAVVAVTSMIEATTDVLVVYEPLMGQSRVVLADIVKDS